MIKPNIEVQHLKGCVSPELLQAIRLVLKPYTPIKKKKKEKKKEYYIKMINDYMYNDN